MPEVAEASHAVAAEVVAHGAGNADAAQRQHRHAADRDPPAPALRCWLSAAIGGFLRVLFHDAVPFVVQHRLLP